MSRVEARVGADTWVRDDHPNRPQGSGISIRLQATHRRGLIHVPMTNIRGRTVLSATLTGHVRDGFVAQTVTAHALASWVPAGKATWNHQPSIVGAGVATALGALSDGDAAVLDIGSIVRSVANGGAWHGIRLTTDATGAGDSVWYAFDAAKASWVLTVELSDELEQPTDLKPSGGGVIGSAAPVLSWSYTALGGTASEQGAFRVQADPAGNFTTPDFDSGWITSGDPTFDLSSSTFTPLAANASTTWRVMTRDSGGVQESAWSDPATFTYGVDPVLVVDSPTGGTIGDSTPNVAFHMTGETMTQWRVRVLDAANNELYDSGLSDGPGSLEIPSRNDDGRRIIRRDDHTYRFQIRAWGDRDRAVAPGHPDFVEQIVDVVFDNDAGVEVPTDFTVSAFAPGDPRTTFTWSLVEAGDAYQIIDDIGEITRVDAEDVTIDAGTYTWTDGGQVQPYEAHTYVVRKVDDGVRGNASNTDTYTSKPIAAWLIPEGDDPIMLDGDAWLDAVTQTEKRVSYATLTGYADIDVVYALMGVTGNFQGSLSNDGDPNTPGVLAAARRLEKLREDVSALPQFVFLNRSMKIRMRAGSTMPASTFDEDNLQHNVVFGFQQVPD